MPTQDEYTDSEIARAFWALLGEKHSDLARGHGALTRAKDEVYISNDERIEQIETAEWAITRASDDVISLGLVIERARAARLVTTKSE